MPSFLQVAEGIGAIAAGIAAIGGVTTWVYERFHRANRRIDNFIEDWNGTEARPGVSARPGVMQRLSSQDVSLEQIKERLNGIEKETTPNGGGSMKDALGRIESGVDGLSDRVSQLETLYERKP